MDPSTKNLQILRDIGIDEWFLYMEKYQPFFNWFSENITNATIFTDAELREYGDLQEENLILSDEALASELIANEAAIADVNISKTDLSILESEVKLYADIERELDQLIADKKRTQIQLSQQTSAVEHTRKRLAADEEANARKCLELARDVQDAQLENTMRIRELNRFYATPDQAAPVFIHQMGMHQYYQQCDTFIKYLEQYMQANFRLLSSAATSDTDAFDCGDEDSGSLGSSGIEADASTVNQLEIINFKLYKSSVELTRQQMKLSASRHIGRADIRSEWKLPGGQNGVLAAIVQQTAELKRTNEEYYTVEVENALDALTFVLRQLASLKVETAAYENTRTKLHRAEGRLARLRDVHAIVADDLMGAEFVWLLMQLDMVKLRNRSLSAVLEAYASESRAVGRRIEQLRTFGRGGTAESLADWWLGALQTAMLDNLPQLMADVVDSGEPTVLGLYERLMVNVSKSMQALRQPQLQRHIAERLSEIATDDVQLRELIQDSVDSKPTLYDVQAKNQLYTIGLALKQIEHYIADFKAKYIKQYTEPMNTNPFLQAKHLLWVWFLTEPKIVLKALKSITTAAKETTKRAPKETVKAIAGIIRKNI